MKQIFIFLFVILMFPAKSQEPVYNQIIPENRIQHKRLDYTLFLSGNMISHDAYGSLFAGGAKVRLFMWKRVSFDSELVIGQDYMHLGPGIIGIPALLLGAGLGFSSDDKDSFLGFLFIAATIVLSAEHVTYHFPVGNTMEISPYVSFLRLKQLKISDNEDTNYSRASFSTGIELNKYFKRFVFSPYVEYNVSYDGVLKGINFGANAGYYFPKK